MSSITPFSLSIIIPVFNESTTVKKVLTDLLAFLGTKNWLTEIIVVNDGSTDNTLQQLKNFNDQIKIISHPYNKGYGAAIKTGVRAAQFDWLLTYDSDGQHEPALIESLIIDHNNYDLIIGARTHGYQGPANRKLGKKFIHWFAGYLVEKKIPDINSGLRLIRRSIMLSYLHIFPDGFSLATTTTLAFLKDGYNVCFVPIQINPRVGHKSTVSYQDGFKTIMFLTRLTMLFAPLRVFLPIVIMLGGLTLISFIYDLCHYNIADTTVLLFSSFLLIFFFGLLADQIAAIRRRLK